MDAVVLLLVVALVSLLIARVATVALTITGLGRESARFQARSALTGVGFTTTEAESVVGHPVRRRIVMTLMLLGSVGLATGVAGVMGTFVDAGAEARVTRGVFLVVALGMLYAASRSPAIDRWLTRLIARLLRRYTTLEARDYERLLHLAGDYSVQEVAVMPGHWLTGRTLGTAALRDEGIIVLGITRSDGSYIGVPGRATPMGAGDVLIVYARGQAVERLGRRRPGDPGDDDHRAAVAEHERMAAAERREDRNAEAADKRQAS